jgi:hypothetical protein
MSANKSLSKLERVPLNEAWKHEAGEFTPWLATWYPHASIEEENRWDEYLDWLTQRLVKMDQVLRPIVKALP